MPEGKVYVRKEGAIHTVYEDTATGQPLPLSSFDDQPAGGAIQTYISVADVRQRFPGREVVLLEKEKRPAPPVIRRSEAVRQEAAAIVASLPKTNTPPPKSRSQLKRRNVQQGKPVDAGVYTKAEPVVSDSLQTARAKEFLKRLEVAHQYASKKNKKILEIQVEVIRELIEEVFE